VYRTVPAAPASARMPLASLGVDTVFLASPSAVTGFVNLVDVDASARLVTIGPSTSEAARALELTVAAEAREPSLEGLLEAMP
jgi:uroporphyrinogen-III synthase